MKKCLLLLVFLGVPFLNSCSDSDDKDDSPVNAAQSRCCDPDNFVIKCAGNTSRTVCDKSSFWLSGSGCEKGVLVNNVCMNNCVDRPDGAVCN